MRKGWAIRKLGDVCTKLTDGSHNPPKGVAHSDYVMLSSQNVFNDRLSYEGVRYLREEDFQNEDRRTSVRKGDVLLTIVGTVGRCAVFSAEKLITLQRSVAVLRPQADLNSRFLMHYLISKSAWLNEEAHGIAQKGLYLKQLAKIPIPVPPIQEQEKIVAELDTLSEVISKKKQQLKELDKLAQSIFYDMFGSTLEEKGWTIKTMGEVGKLQRGAGLQKKDFVGNGMPCIHYGQLHTSFGAYTTKHLTSIPKELYAVSKIAHKGDLLLAITSEDVEGSCKSTAWLGDYDVAVGSDAAIFTHNQNPIYISYCTRTPSFFAEKSKYAHGFKVTHIKTSEIAQIPIAIPPLNLQNEFAQKVEAIEKQKELIKQSIVETEILFNSRMDYWFN